MNCYLRVLRGELRLAPFEVKINIRINTVEFINVCVYVMNEFRVKHLDT